MTSFPMSEADVLAPAAGPFSALEDPTIVGHKMAVIRVLFHRRQTPAVSNDVVDELALLLAKGVFERLPRYRFTGGNLRGLKIARAIDREAFQVAGDTHVCCELLTHFVFDAMSGDDCDALRNVMRDVVYERAAIASDTVFGDRDGVQLVFGFRRDTDVRFGYR